jgi:hypothetical protein
MQAEDQRGNRVRANLNTNTQSRTRREILLEGFEMLLKRQQLQEKALLKAIPVEINGVLSMPAKYRGVESNTWVDGYVSHWLGGKRVGVTVVWELSDGYTYEYDIFSHKLTRTLRANDATPTS